MKLSLAKTPCDSLGCVQIKKPLIEYFGGVNKKNTRRKKIKSIQPK
jgi:hypothetical protein